MFEYIKSKLKNAEFMTILFYGMTGILLINRLFTFMIMMFFANYSSINVDSYSSGLNTFLSL